MTPVALFTWLAATPVYRDLHREAVRLLDPATGNETWLDVGCGPGLITRAAASRGFSAVGVDTSPGMIRAARQISPREGLSARFDVGSATELRAGSADVVSAAALLCVVADPAATAAAMWTALRPGGAVLVVETSASMTPDVVRGLDRSAWSTRDRLAIALWANVRRGRALDPTRLAAFADAEVSFQPLLHGLVGAWLFRRV